jgi:hypothetical protein
MFPQLGVPIPPTRDDENQAAARKFMASVSRREIMSVNAPGAGRQFRDSNAVTRGSTIEPGVSIHEQARHPPPADIQSFGHGPRWHATKEGAEHEERTALRRLHRQHFSAEELRIQCQQYAAQHDQRLRKKDGMRWQALIDFRDVVKKEAPNVPLAGRDSAVYELLFKAAPGQHLSKPRFFVVMRKIFGLGSSQGAAAESTEGDSHITSVLERTYKAFDMADRGEFDWRLFLMMYRVVAMPLVAFRDHFLFGYGVYASCGSFDGGGNNPAAMSTFLTSSATSENRELAKKLPQVTLRFFVLP